VDWSMKRAVVNTVLNSCVSLTAGSLLTVCSGRTPFLFLVLFLSV